MDTGPASGAGDAAEHAREALPVAVVIPAHDRPAMTARAVRSALAQRPRPPAEVIVVDDCSTDDTGPAAAAAGARVIRHAVNQGEAAARNTGVAATSQPWVGLLDSDDEWLPDLLATLWPLREDHVVVAGAVLHRGPDGRSRYAGPTGRHAHLLTSPRAVVYPENLLRASSVLVRAETIRAAGGFRSSVRFGADLDLWLRVLERGTGVLSPEVVAVCHDHGGQMTQQRDEMARGVLDVLNAYADRPWWSAWRLEGWRGGAAWDDLRRQVDVRGARGALRPLMFIARHPGRVAGLTGILLRRRALRARTRQLGLA